MALGNPPRLVTTSQGNNVATLNVPVTTTLAGSLLVVHAYAWGRTFGAGHVTDNQGNVYTLDQTGSSGNIGGGAYYCANAIGGVTQVSATATGSVDDISLAFYEITGADLTSPADVSIAGSGTSATHASGTTGTTSQANEIVIISSSHEGSTATPTAGSGYTTLTAAMFKSSASDIPIATTYKFVTATGTQAGTISWANSPFACILTSYKEAGGGGGGPTGILLKMMIYSG